MIVHAKIFVLLFVICNGSQGECHQERYQSGSMEACEEYRDYLQEKARDKYFTISVCQPEKERSK